VFVSSTIMLVALLIARQVSLAFACCSLTHLPPDWPTLTTKATATFSIRYAHATVIKITWQQITTFNSFVRIF